ncbi:MAG: Uma2 family endonuclease [Isosphaeraceae bacterium]
MATVSTLMTTEELLALPENGTDRWLIAGELREIPMTVRNRFHGRLTIRVGTLLEVWRETQPVPRGQVVGGETGVILRHDPDTTVGVDVAYISAEVMARQTASSTLIDGIPTLIVEILSPSDTVRNVNEKIDVYMAVKVPIVWIIDPHRQNVTVYQPGKPAQLFNIGDELTAEPHLPGFRVQVAQIFD